MLLATLVLAALVPVSAPPAPEPTPAFLSLHDWRPHAPTPATVPEHVLAKGVQLVGGSFCGVVVGIGGGAAALIPALLLGSMDSGDVGAGALSVGAGVGYSIGAAWAITSAGEEIAGCHGSRLMTRLGTGAGLVLTVSIFGTGLVEPTIETVVFGALVPPLMGILAFELTRTGPRSPRKLTTSLPVGALVTAGLGTMALRHSELEAVEPSGRTVLPLFVLRW